MSGRGEGLTCFSAFRGPFPPQGIIRAFKTPVRPSSAKTIARNRSGGQMGVLGRKNYAFLGGRSLQMSAADTFNAVCVFPLPEPFSFPTFQCQKLRLFLAHAAERVRLRGKFVHMALRRRRRRRRRVVSRKKFRHDMNNHTVSQSSVAVGLQFGRAVSDLASESFSRSCLAMLLRDFLVPRAFVHRACGNFLANLNVDFILRRL